MLKVKDITFAYPRKHSDVLRNISLTVEPGGIYGLLGRNGVGKSTLLYLISGLLSPQRGQVTLDGVDTRLRLPKTLQDIFIVPEIFELPKIKLSEYVKITAPFYPNFSLDDMQRHLDVFEMSYDVDLGQLSMGQAKKVFMSFALATNTKLLLMDEPTNGLDIPAKAAFRSFIASSMTDERSIIISTHQVQDINLLLDHVVIMENSGVLLNRSVGEILERLAFGVVFDPADTTGMLYARQSLGGIQTISLNEEGLETELNLETLFDFVTREPQTVAKIFEEVTMRM